MHREVIVVIPAYNEEKNIGRVVSGALKYADRVLVVNDGSRDLTAIVAFESGAIVISQANQGAGAATRRGIAEALKYYPDLQALVLMDGDGQHDPDDLYHMLEAFFCGCDLVIGQRSMSLKDMPLSRWIANKTCSAARNVWTSNVISDAECGYRVFSRRTLEAIGISTDHFGFCEEVAIKARALGLKVAEVPIKTIYGDEQRKYPFYVKLFHGFGIINSILRWRWIYEWKPALGIQNRSKLSGRRTKPLSPEIPTQLK